MAKSGLPAYYKMENNYHKNVTLAFVASFMPEPYSLLNHDSMDSLENLFCYP